MFIADERSVMSIHLWLRIQKEISSTVGSTQTIEAAQRQPIRHLIHGNTVDVAIGKSSAQKGTKTTVPIGGMAW
jgi:hypothetical protein